MTRAEANWGVSSRSATPKGAAPLTEGQGLPPKRAHIRGHSLKAALQKAKMGAAVLRPYKERSSLPAGRHDISWPL